MNNFQRGKKKHTEHAHKHTPLHSEDLYKHLVFGVNIIIIVIIINNYLV